MRCPNCSAECPDSNVICLSCGCETVSGLPMRWHLLLIHAVLWVAAVALILLGILFLVGMHYLAQGMAPGMVYSSFVALNVIDVVYGVFLILLGVLCIVIRGRLAAFRKNGPLLLCIVYALSVLSAAVYSVVSAAAVGVPARQAFGLTELLSVLGMILGVVLNAVYYRKRDFLFHA